MWTAFWTEFCENRPYMPFLKCMEMGRDWLSTDILSIERDFCDQIFWIHSPKISLRFVRFWVLFSSIWSESPSEQHPVLTKSCFSFLTNHCISNWLHAINAILIVWSSVIPYFSSCFLIRKPILLHQIICSDTKQQFNHRLLKWTVHPKI